MNFIKIRLVVWPLEGRNEGDLGFAVTGFWALFNGGYLGRMSSYLFRNFTKMFLLFSSIERYQTSIQSEPTWTAFDHPKRADRLATRWNFFKKIFPWLCCSFRFIFLCNACLVLNKNPPYPLPVKLWCAIAPGLLITWQWFANNIKVSETQRQFHSFLSRIWWNFCDKRRISFWLLKGRSPAEMKWTPTGAAL